MDPHIKVPTIIQSVGNKPKLINEFIGMVNTNSAEGAEYIAVCIPAFSLDTVHRE